MNRPSLILGAAFASMLAVQPAFAESIRISTAGIDLSTEAGRQEFDSRLERTIAAVCGVNKIQTGTILRNRESKACVSKVRAAAAEQLAAMMKDDKAGG